MLLRFYPYVKTSDLFGDVFMMLMTWQFGDVCYLSAAMFFENFFSMHVLRTVEDVTSIS
jgi:hypothetical protein